MTAQQNIIQTVIFKLQPYVLRDEFVKMAQRRFDWLSVQDGFVSYELSEGEGEEQNWCERIEWQSMQAAMQATQFFMMQKTYQQLELLIDENYTGIFAKPILF